MYVLLYIMYVNIYIYMFVCMHACMYVHSCICMYEYLCTYIYIHIYIYIDTHVYIHLFPKTQAKNRQFRSDDGDDVFSLVGNMDDVPLLSELEAVKRAIATVYLALPLGSIQMHTDGDYDGGDVYMAITEPNGWNDMIDQAWRGAVDQTSSPTVLMECILLLEYYINRGWFTSPQNKLLGSYI
jgi:hypothetical protein